MDNPADLSGREALLQALLSLSNGDSPVRLPAEGIEAEIALAFNAAAAANERLAKEARRLAEKVTQVEHDNRALDLAMAELEDKTAQLALRLRDKSEVLAGRAQALRAPIDSMLTLAKLLADNEGNHLSAKQIDYAQTIYSAGTNLLTAIDALVGESQGDSGSAPPAPVDADARAASTPPITTHAAAVKRRDAPGRQPYRGRRSRRPDDGVVLIADGNAAVAGALLDRVRRTGYLGEIAADIATLQTLLGEIKPNAIILGTSLSDSDGWKVLELLKHDPETRLLPVSMILAQERMHKCLQLDGGVQSLDNLHDTSAMDSIKKAMTTVAPADLAVERIDVAGSSSGADGARAAAIAIIRHGHRLEEALDQTTQFLHRVIGSPLPPRRRIVTGRRRGMFELAGKKVLIVDSDIRDVFAITGALEQQGMRVVHAENGNDGIEALQSNPDIDAVLMNTMLPQRDGYDTIRVMRGLAEFTSLPIIALTDRNEHGDRDRCVAAGASDYLAKPVNDEQLLALLRAWLLKLH